MLFRSTSRPGAKFESAGHVKGWSTIQTPSLGERPRRGPAVFPSPLPAERFKLRGTQVLGAAGLDWPGSPRSVVSLRARSTFGSLSTLLRSRSSRSPADRFGMRRCSAGLPKSISRVGSFPREPEVPRFPTGVDICEVRQTRGIAGWECRTIGGSDGSASSTADLWLNDTSCNTLHPESNRR